jgi:putative salt-induced outer membrane protein
MARGDYALPSVFGSYLSVSYERNTFSGLRSRVVTNGGLTAHVIRLDRMKLSLESGLNITAQRQVAPTSPPIDALGGRAAFAFLRRIGEKAGATQAVEFLPNFKEGKKLRINTETTLTAPITKQVGLKLSFVIRYDRSPAPTFQTTDRLFTSGITVAF